MRIKLRKENNYFISDWSGGKTKELAIFPPGAKYADREFIWRLSSATVDLDESDFTLLPDYDRVLMVLKGSAVLTYDGKRSVRLDELEQDSFDGAWNTKSYGRITDFNLMTRKGTAGKVDVLRPGASAEEYADTLESDLKNRTHALYCKEGYLIVNAGGEQKMVSPGQLLVMEFGEEEPSYTLMGDGIVIRSQIAFDGESFYDEPEEETAPPDDEHEEKERRTDNVSHEEYGNYAEPGDYGFSGLSEESVLDHKGGFAEDYLWSFILSNTQFRGAKKLFPKLNKYVYDDTLHSKIRRLERLFATFFVFIIGLLILLSFSMRGGELKDAEVLTLIVVWLVIDILIVSPVLYYLLLPKPIKSHIHDINKISEEDAETIMKDRNKNERLEKILKKYSNSGRNVGTVMAEKARREKELDE